MRLLSSRSLAGVGFGAVIIAAGIALLTPPADGYEMSIYAAFPWYFWALLIASVLVGQLIVLRAGVTADKDGSDWWFGVLLVLLSNALLLFLPYARGYPYFERADVLTHLGHIRTIQTTGMIGPENIYPNIHQLVLALARLQALSDDHLAAVHELEPEVVLLGTGARQTFPDRELMLGLLQAGIGLEIMDTASACRTYNVLMSEGRRVVAALIIER